MEDKSWLYFDTSIFGCIYDNKELEEISALLFEVFEKTEEKIAKETKKMTFAEFKE